MGRGEALFPSSLRFSIFYVLLIAYQALAGSIGINYGQVADNLPSPEDVVPLVKAVGATRLKLYDTDPKVLKAFGNTNVEFIVSVPNEYLSKIKDPAKAQAWVKQNVQAYLPATKITCIAVGNEVLTFNDTTLSGNLLPAMQSVHAALVSLNLDKQVTILEFHVKTSSPFLINAYPYFAYKANPKQVSLDFVLFQPNPGIVDPVSNLHYDNMLFAQMDAVHSALDSLGYKNVCVQISETGWPSKGDADEAGATEDNARKYNCNLMKLMTSKKGTPMRPTNDLNIYVFAMFNENMKPGPTSERNYGLFKPDGTPAYPLGINLSTNISSGGSGGSTPSTSSPPGTSSTGYLSISSDSVRPPTFCETNGVQGQKNRDVFADCNASFVAGEVAPSISSSLNMLSSLEFESDAVSSSSSSLTTPARCLLLTSLIPLPRRARRLRFRMFLFRLGNIPWDHDQQGMPIHFDFEGNQEQPESDLSMRNALHCVSSKGITINRQRYNCINEKKPGKVRCEGRPVTLASSPTVLRCELREDNFCSFASCEEGQPLLPAAVDEGLVFFKESTLFEDPISASRLAWVSSLL
nr:glucan endo-1,3-beta-glucosidase 11-like [Ipomoea batatas]